MQCPYCTSEISGAAVVCPVCTRDLYLLKPLLEKISGLESRLAELASVSAPALEARIADLETQLADARSSKEIAELARKPAKPFVISAAIAFGITLLLLLVAHGLIVMMYDLKPLYLRIASLLLPLPFGFVLHVRHPQRIGMTAVLAALTGLVAVLGMSAVTAYVDNAPVLPENVRDWREFIEYSASIAFSLITGTLLAKLLHVTRRAHEAGPLTMFLARMFTFDEDGELGLQKMVARVNKVVAAVTPAGAAALSVWTGIKAVIGGE
jgi:pheromone shutdown protein TraB